MWMQTWADFLKWLSQHGISPELPLILVSMAMGAFITVFVLCFQDNLKGGKKMKEFTVTYTAQFTVVYKDQPESERIPSAEEVAEVTKAALGCDDVVVSDLKLFVNYEKEGE